MKKIIVTLLAALPLLGTAQGQEKVNNGDALGGDKKLSVIASFNQEQLVYDMRFPDKGPFIPLAKGTNVDSPEYDRFKQKKSFFSTYYKPVYDKESGKDIKPVKEHAYSSNTGERYKFEFDQKGNIETVAFTYNDKSKEKFYEDFKNDFHKVGDKYYENDYSGYFKPYIDKYGNKKADYFFTDKSNSSGDILAKRDKIKELFIATRKTYDFEEIDPKKIEIFKTAIIDKISSFEKALKFFTTKYYDRKLEIEFEQRLNTLKNEFEHKLTTSPQKSRDYFSKNVEEELEKLSFSQKGDIYVNAKGKLDIEVFFVYVPVDFFKISKGKITWYKWDDRAKKVLKDNSRKETESNKLLEEYVKKKPELSGKYRCSLKILKVEGKTITEELNIVEGWK